MRKLVLIGMTVAALMIGSAAPALAVHSTKGCTTAAPNVAGTPGAAAVAAACARGR
jgi:hypothetical protein